jgi:hypothetical protein
MSRRPRKRSPSDAPALDPALCAAIADARDRQWLEAIERTFASIPSYYIPPRTAIDATLARDAWCQRMIREAIKQRDAEWREWLEMPLMRAAFPNGPRHHTKGAH